MASELMAELLKLRDDETLTIRKESSAYGGRLALVLTRRRQVGKQIYAQQMVIAAVELQDAKCPENILAYHLWVTDEQITKAIQTDAQAKGEQPADAPLEVDRP